MVKCVHTKNDDGPYTWSVGATPPADSPFRWAATKYCIQTFGVESVRFAVKKSSAGIWHFAAASIWGVDSAKQRFKLYVNCMRFELQKFVYSIWLLPNGKGGIPTRVSVVPTHTF